MKAPTQQSSWLTPAPPAVAIEIASHRVTVAAIEGPADKLVVGAYASEPLPDGAVTPALAGPNVADVKVVAAALSRALTRAGLGSTRRAALVVPDSVARVSLLSFERLPDRPADLDQLVRWQLGKAMPFSLDEAQVAYFSAGDDGTPSLVTAVSRRDVVAQYEAVAAAAGIRAGIVDLASFNVMNAVMGAGADAASGDSLLVHLAAEATTLAILRGKQLMFYRHRMAVDEEPLGALVHQTAMYHEDRLGGQVFARVWICGGGAGADLVRREVAGRLGAPAETVDVRPAVGLRDDAGMSAEVMDALAAPIGMLIRERKAA